MKKRKIPVIIRLQEDQVFKADLLKEVRIDRHRLTRELIRQPGKYAFWAAMYSKASERVALYEERLATLESQLFIRYSKSERKQRVSDIKHLVAVNQEYRILKSKVRKWKDYERHLKFAEKSFQQRLYALQSINANVRKEWDTEKNGGDE
jgi:hypothetical protein